MGERVERSPRRSSRTATRKAAEPDRTRPADAGELDDDGETFTRLGEDDWPAQFGAAPLGIP